MNTIKIDLKNFQDASNFYQLILTMKGNVMVNGLDLKDIRIFNGLNFMNPIEVQFELNEDYETYKCSCSK